MSGVEVAALFGAGRVVAACMQMLGTKQALTPNVEKLRQRLLAVARTLAGPEGESADGLEDDVRLVPLRELLNEATGWVEARKGKLETQAWAHQFAMAAWT
jgi:hypothetical protein